MRCVARSVRGEVLSLVAGSIAAVLVAVGFAQGVWWENLHNGILGLTLSLVGVWLAAERPRSQEGALFLAAGVVEAVMFAGRQIGHAQAAGGASPWLGWLGVWPIALGMLATTLAVVCFPDGHLPSPRWRMPAILAGVLAAACALLSAVWSVGWAQAGLTNPPPFGLAGRGTAEDVWAILAHPLYLLLQLSWVVAVAVRWRAGRSRAPLLGLLLGVACAFAVLAIGQVAGGSVEPGLVMVSLIPLVAGWSAVYGHILARYRSLAWLTGAQQRPSELPAALARTMAESLDVEDASVWMGSEAAMHPVGVWPETNLDLAPRSLDALPERVWPVCSGDQVVGALAVPGATLLTRSEERMMRDLAAQAALLLDRLTLAELVQRERTAGYLEHLTPREAEVLELMARGFTNAAICQELHLSVKTVEPVVSTVFTKLGLHADPTLNRRVLAALQYHRS